MKFDYSYYRELVLKPRAAYKRLCGHPCYRLFTVIQIWISANVMFLKIGNFKLRAWDKMQTVITSLVNPKPNYAWCRKNSDGVIQRVSYLDYIA
jgi:hypothetical protein